MLPIPLFLSALPVCPLVPWHQGFEPCVILTTHVSVLQCRMECRDVPAETLYDVLHDIEYRKKWDSNVIETFDIARLTVNADVGYYSCEQAPAPCPTSRRPPPTSRPASSSRLPPGDRSQGRAAQGPEC